MRDRHDICISKTKPADRARINAMVGPSIEALVTRYRTHRQTLNDEQTGMILKLFCYGANSSEISEKTDVPLASVRAVISYACSRSSDLYKWHSERTVSTGFVNTDIPARAESYVRYAPEI